MSRVAELIADSETLIRAVASGRRKGHQVRYRRVEMRYVDLKRGRHLQVTSYDDTQAHVQNHAAPKEVIAALLAQPHANWHLETTTSIHQVRISKKGEVYWSETPNQGEVDRGHDQRKTRLLDPGEPVLRALGISDQQGRIKPSRQAKYRQVEDFSRILLASVEAAAAAGELPSTGPLRVVDLGCGNAYLTFAAAVLLARDRSVEIIGIDVKEQAREHNARIAAELGLSQVSFQVSDITGAELPWRPHVVLALHACDTATDDCLARAVSWQAPLILAAPCCHKDLSRQLRDALVPARYQPLVRDGILRERFADTLTDAIRADLLRTRGYRVDVMEFVDSAHTPRNTMIRAVWTGREGAPQSEILVTELGLQPKLAQLLAE